VYDEFETDDTRLDPNKLFGGVTPPPGQTRGGTVVMEAAKLGVPQPAPAVVPPMTTPMKAPPAAPHAGSSDAHLHSASAVATVPPPSWGRALSSPDHPAPWAPGAPSSSSRHVAAAPHPSAGAFPAHGGPGVPAHGPNVSPVAFSTPAGAPPAPALAPVAVAAAAPPPQRATWALWLLVIGLVVLGVAGFAVWFVMRE